MPYPWPRRWPSSSGWRGFGSLTDLLSPPVRCGYRNGIALLILVSQVPKLCGFSTDADGVVDVHQLARGLADGEDERYGAGARRRGARHDPRGAALDVERPRAARGDGGRDRARPGSASTNTALPSSAICHRAYPASTSDARSQRPRVAARRRGRDRLRLLRRHEHALTDLRHARSLRRGAQPGARPTTRRRQRRRRVVPGVPGRAAAPPGTPVAEAAAGARTQLTGVVGGGDNPRAARVLPSLFSQPPVSRCSPPSSSPPPLGLIEIRGSSTWPARARREMVVSPSPSPGGGARRDRGDRDRDRYLACGVHQPGVGPHSADLVRVDGVKGYHDCERHPEGHQVPGWRCSGSTHRSSSPTPTSSKARVTLSTLIVPVRARTAAALVTGCTRIASRIPEWARGLGEPSASERLGAGWGWRPVRRRTWGRPWPPYARPGRTR